MSDSRNKSDTEDKKSIDDASRFRPVVRVVAPLPLHTAHTIALPASDRPDQVFFLVVGQNDPPLVP